MRRSRAKGAAISVSGACFQFISTVKSVMSMSKSIVSTNKLAMSMTNRLYPPAKSIMSTAKSVMCTIKSIVSRMKSIVHTFQDRLGEMYWRFEPNTPVPRRVPLSTSLVDRRLVDRRLHIYAHAIPAVAWHGKFLEGIAIFSRDVRVRFLARAKSIHCFSVRTSRGHGPRRQKRLQSESRARSSAG